MDLTVCASLVIDDTINYKAAETDRYFYGCLNSHFGDLYEENTPVLQCVHLPVGHAIGRLLPLQDVASLNQFIVPGRLAHVCHNFDDVLPFLQIPLVAICAPYSGPRNQRPSTPSVS